MQDQVGRLRARSLLTTLPAYTTSQTGTSIDRLAADGGYESLSLFLHAGTWTDGTFAFVIKDSPDNSTFTTVTAANLVDGASFVSVSSAATAINQKVAYIGGARYVRVDTTVTGSPSTGLTYDLIGVLGNARNNPTTA